MIDPIAVHSVDIDGDGDQDMLSASRGDSKIAWYANDGTGDFGPQQVITTNAGQVNSLSAADLDGDGDQDILTTDDNSVNWYKNDGNGSFRSDGVGGMSYPSSIFPADLDGDGDEDVLFATLGGDRVAWLENDGTGRFETAKNITSSIDDPRSVYAADLDGDSDYDAVSASSSNGKITWYANDGTGDFGPEQLITTSADQTGLVRTADFDEDGDQDILAALTVSSTDDGSIGWYENEGAGSFGSLKTISTSGATSIEIADLDGDGDLDVVSNTETGSVFENMIGEGGSDADGFGSAFYVLPLSGTSSINYVYTADINGDNSPDIASITSSSTTSDAVAWYENQFDQDQGFGPQNTIAPSYPVGSFSLVHSADLNGDGSRDVLVASTLSSVSWLENDGTGNFGSPQTITSTFNDPRSLATTDLDGDDDQDVLIASGDDDTVAWYANDGTGGFGPQQVITVNADRATSIYTADLDSDGDQDVLVSSFLDNKVAWHPNDSNGNFGTPIVITTDAQGANAVYAADLDGDGDQDVLSASEYDDTIAWYANDGTGKFGYQRVLDASADGASAVHAADLDGDGEKEVLSASRDGDTIAWYDNSGSFGDISFSDPRTITTTAYRANSVSAADIDNDGDNDIISSSEEGITWHKNSGGGKFDSEEVIAEGYQRLPPTVVDLDGDGDQDFVTAESSILSWHENTLDALLIPPSEPYGVSATAGSDAIELTWQLDFTSDFDGFRVYRSESPIDSVAGPSAYTPFAEVRQRFFSDTDVDTGKRYYYRITAVDTLGKVSSFSNEGDALFRSPVSFSIGRGFGDGSSAQDYRLVALPGKIDQEVASNIRGEAGTDWQMFWDDGSESEYLVRYDGSDMFRFQSGQGFWLTSTQDWTLQDTVATYPLIGDSIATVSLHGGWNIISNPLGKDVSWSAVEASNGGTLQPLWAFDGSFVETNSFNSARSGEAFYFLNDKGLDSLRIPFPNTSTTKSSYSVKKTRPPTGALSLSATTYSGDESTIRIAIDPHAKAGKDAHDVFAPPTDFETLSLRLRAPHDSTTSRQKYLVAEKRPPNKSGHTFDLTLIAKPGRQVFFQVQGSDAFQSQDVALLYPYKSQEYDLHSDEGIQIEAEKDTTLLRLVIGSKPYVDRQSRSSLPKKLSFGSYPNPATTQATFTYALPEASDVELSIYDVLGRRIATLINKHHQAGRYDIHWSLNGLSSGVYFGHLEVGDRTITQKLTVIQ